MLTILAMRKNFRTVTMRQSGFSLAEMMVGLLIGLLAMLAVTSMFILTNQQKKTTTSGADAQTVGVLATFMLERDLRMAGFGLVLPTSVALPDAICDIDVHSSSSAEDFSLSMAPMQIIKQAAGTPDSITVFYGNAERSINAATSSLNANVAVGATDFTLNSSYGFSRGSLFLVVPRATASSLNQLGSAAGHDGRPDCALFENVSANDANPLSGVLSTGYGITRGGNTTNYPSYYNRSTAPSPGTLISFNGGTDTGAMVLNLGNRPGRDASGSLLCDLGNCPVHRTYAIANEQLVVTDNLLEESRRAALPVAEGVVMLKAQFGKDTNSDGVVDSWDATLSDGATDTTGEATLNENDALWSQWNRVRAVRIALVARSQQRERDMVTGTTLTLWTGETWTLAEEQRHYRYRVYHTVVPVRNNLWRQ